MAVKLRNRVGRVGRVVGAMLALGAITMAHAEAPRIVAGSNRDAKVIFDRQDCVVYYDARGHETNRTSGCTRDQVERSRDAIERYRRERGWSRDGDRQDDRETPRIVAGRHGDGEVVFDRNGCVVRFDEDGRKTSQSSRCSRDQVDRARDAMDRYRRERGFERPSNGDRTPRVTINSNGSGRVDIGGCRVDYNRDGRRTGSSRDCSSNDLGRADRAMEAHRREQGHGGGRERPTDSNSRFEWYLDRDGTGWARFRSNGCTVYFDSEAHETRHTSSCSGDQRREAGRLFEDRRDARKANQQGNGA